MASEQEQATKLIEDVTRDGISNDEVIDIYAKWAENYDKDVAAYGRKTPEETIASITKIETNKNCRILDIAAGTGIAGQMLRDNGFTNIDALDGSPKMLAIAEKKKVYDNIFCQLFTSEESPNIAAGTYDAVTCVGSFYPGHLDQTCFPEVMRILKTGGRFYFTRPIHKQPGEIEIAVEDMEKKGILRVFEKRFVENMLTHGDGYVFVLQKC